MEQLGLEEKKESVVEEKDTTNASEQTDDEGRFREKESLLEEVAFVGSTIR